MTYSEMAWNCLPYLKWVNIIYVDPYASYPILKYDSVNITSFQPITAPVTIRHPPSWNNTRFNITYNIYSNTTLITSGTINGIAQGQKQNISIPAQSAGTLTLVGDLYMDGTFAGEWNQTINVRAQEYQCYGWGCVDYYTRIFTNYTRTDH